MGEKEIDFEEARQAWLSCTQAEGHLWLEHIDSHANRIVTRQSEIHQLLNGTAVAPAGREVPTLQMGDLLYNCFAFANWLAHIRLRKHKPVTEAENIAWIAEFSTWPYEVCEALWYCIRNPIMHTGRSSSFHEYDRKSVRRHDGSVISGRLYADLHPDLRFDPLRFQPDEFKPTRRNDGYMVMPSFFKEGGHVFNFYFPGLRRKLDDALALVLADLRACSHNDLRKLAKVNATILMFRITG